MNMRIYLATKNMTLKDFSNLLGYTPTYMSHIMNGHKIPNERLAKHIERMTDGMVRFSTQKEKESEKVNENENHKQDENCLV